MKTRQKFLWGWNRSRGHGNDMIVRWLERMANIELIMVLEDTSVHVLLMDGKKIKFASRRLWVSLISNGGGGFIPLVGRIHRICSLSWNRWPTIRHPMRKFMALRTNWFLAYENDVLCLECWVLWSQPNLLDIVWRVVLEEKWSYHCIKNSYKYYHNARYGCLQWSQVIFTWDLAKGVKVPLKVDVSHLLNRVQMSTWWTLLKVLYFMGETSKTVGVDWIHFKFWLRPLLTYFKRLLVRCFSFTLSSGRTADQLWGPWGLSVQLQLRALHSAISCTDA